MTGKLFTTPQTRSITSTEANLPLEAGAKAAADAIRDARIADFTMVTSLLHIKYYHDGTTIESLLGGLVELNSKIAGGNQTRRCW